jgi:hypothetical protein
LKRDALEEKSSSPYEANLKGPFTEARGRSVPRSSVSTRRKLLRGVLEWSSTFRNYTHSEPRFRALLTEGDARVLFHHEVSNQSAKDLAWKGVRL